MKLLSTFSLLFFPFFLLAQTPPGCPLAPAIHLFHPNNLRLNSVAAIGKSGDYLQASLESGFPALNEVPAGQYAHTMWVGGVDPGGNLRLAGSVFTGENFDIYLPGPLDLGGSADPLDCSRWNRVWTVTRLEINLHQADFADNGQIDNPLPNIVGWPGRGNPNFETLYGFSLPDRPVLAPFIDYNNDGIYNAYDGDYPHPATLSTSVTPAEMAWVIFNSSPTSLLFEYQNTFWALACDDNDLLNNTIFQTVSLRNAGTERIDSLYVGLLQDPELGSFEDDFIGTSTALNSVFVYNRDNFDGPASMNNFGENPPAFALTLLNQPLDNTTYYSSLFVDPPVGLTPPSTFGEYYNYLTGHLRDGTPMTVGGDGYQSGGPTTRFFFDGDPNDPGSWALINENLVYLDYRTLANAKIGSLEPGQSASLDYAYSLHRGSGLDHLQNVELMFQRLAELQAAYFSEFTNVCAYTACVDDCVWPGDTDRDGIVNHRDLLAVGGAWDNSGPARDGFVNWAPKDAINWGQPTYLGDDQKHADADGDGVIGLTDTEVIKDFSGFRTPWWSPAPDAYTPGTDFVWRITPASIDTNNIQANQIVFVTVRFDSLKAVRGAALEIEWDTAYWAVNVAVGSAQAGSVNMSKRSDTQLDISRIRIDSASVYSDGSWALVQVKAKDIPPTQSNTTYFRLKNIKGVGPDGEEVVLGAYPQKFVFAGGSSSTYTADPAAHWRLTPNPAATHLRIEAPGEQLQEVAFFDLAGRPIHRLALSGGEQATIPVAPLPRGVVMVQIRSADKTIVRKLVLAN